MNNGGLKPRGLIASHKSLVVVCVATLLVLSGCSSAKSATSATGASNNSKDVRIVVLSNRADLVSGGQALVAVLLPNGIDASKVQVRVNNTDASSSFSASHWHSLEPALDSSYSGLDPATNAIAGEVTNLKMGANSVVAEAPGGGAQLTITNHSLDGPVFSGPQIQPWICQPGALDAVCNRPTTFEYQYLSSTTKKFAPYDPSHPPTDVATTTTQTGDKVPFIVRVEHGVIDRDDYQIAALFDPSKPWTPWSPQPQFNHKAMFVQGASCGNKYGEQSNDLVVLGFHLDAIPSAVEGFGAQEALGLGFATMSTALANSAHNCNVAVQAEAAMMVKEHFVNTYGPVRYTLAMGESGGSLSELQDDNAYPGLYQGLVAEATFDDAWSNGIDAEDCNLALNYFNQQSRWGAGVTWTSAQEDAAMGKRTPAICNAWVNVEPEWTVLSPSRPPITATADIQNCGLPDSQVFDEHTNPKGVRCSFQDYMVNVFGRRPDGYANSPVDNTGVQYGLDALKSGAITPAQFVDLNTKIGGHDINYNWQPARSKADSAALSPLYRSGAINEATNLSTVPIIDVPGGDVDIHETYHPFALSDRMDAAYGNHDNNIVWCCGLQKMPDALVLMDNWVGAIAKDHTSHSVADKVRTLKPSTVQNICLYNGTNYGQNQAACRKAAAGLPTRAAAGGTGAADVMKCQLEPLRRSDYRSVQFTDAEWTSLEAAFPTGVCNWTTHGVDQQPTVPWQTYQNGPGGQPLGPPPQSQPTKA